ncbi:sigma factor-like helix-turn-helix DNA-binding protein [Microbacterium chocolatum]|uniref:RNA polymerase sigma factor n=1 Tax=Microbacterium aurantiacum TaxID=162393 RepID=UPI00338F741C
MDPHRPLIGLVYWERFSLAEASSILGKKEGTVRGRYHRARTALRSQLEADTTASVADPARPARQTSTAPQPNRKSRLAPGHLDRDANRGCLGSGVDKRECGCGDHEPEDHGAGDGHDGPSPEPTTSWAAYRPIREDDGADATNGRRDHSHDGSCPARLKCEQTVV